ncbi:MAG: deoxyribodipyrimidine photo-lyase, partial [Flavobacteriales bacterium]|nr:deoxyribodipyrimidine photo-lyase [Flavobacteriales bacterium]
DYEPSARKRDQEVYDFLTLKGISFKGVKDQVIFEKNEVLKADGTPYTVFTPYSKKWKELYASQTRLPVPELKSSDLVKCDPLPFPTLGSMGFSGNALPIPSKSVSDALLASYATTRDIPGIAGTSRLSVHLRFGTISIRQLMYTAMKASGKFTDELIWREFYQMILYHFPHTVDAAFKPAYDRIQWINDEHQFAAWCAGRTGYPMVDAGMRELNETGYMHNRVRMVVASFLCKHLLIDWRWGERYFAEKLLDYDQASNVGGWQWAAGCGCDAAPYFRIFNPTSQQEKFDPDAVYIRRWVLEWNTPRYSKPIVNHEMARNRCIVEYKKALQAV